MEEFELRSQVLLGEDSTRQFKREPSADAKMAGEIVAFANSGGGRIFVGVEKGGDIHGMSGAEAGKVGEDMAKIAWDSVRPPFSILTQSVATSDGIVSTFPMARPSPTAITRGFLKRWNSRVQGEGSFNQAGHPEVPDTVFEELLINALIHRDYFIKDSIKVFIFDDRIEIRSPGKLPNSLTVEQIRRGLRRSRNVLLASFAPELLNYRGIGSGVLRALKSWPSISWFNDTDGEEVVATIHLTRPST